MENRMENELLENGTGKEAVKQTNSEFIYNVTQRPPITMTVFLAFQQALLSLAGSLAVSTFAAEAVCARDDVEIRAELLSSTLFMNGLTTLFMVTLGIRLPLYQGAAALYIVPLMALQAVNHDRCSLNATSITSEALSLNESFYTAEQEQAKAFIYFKLREFSGCLIVAGFVHCVLGATGVIGLAMRAIGPVTVVPTVLLTGIYLCRATTKFSKTYWGISLPTAAMAIFLSIYLRKFKIPIPIWTRKKGFHVIRYPLQQVYAILIAMLFGWMLSGILTETGFLTDDPKSTQYQARTDAKISVLTSASWFNIPYPGQFGAPTFNTGVFAAFLIATLVSILDSIGDYYACAKMCRVPPPPMHSVNRGIAIEGLCTAISGAVGCGHATSTQGGNIGAIGVTRVASRAVFFGVAVIYILFGLIGKFSALFITMPYPVLGGGMVIMYGMFTGVILSNLSEISLSSSRNLAIIGISILTGLMIPYWIETTPDVVFTGEATVDNTIKVVLANPNIVGGVISCFLDNTAPGTTKERGIEAWHIEKYPDGIKRQYSEGIDIYDPLLPLSWFSYRIMKFLPIFPYKRTRKNSPDFHQLNDKPVSGIINSVI